MTEMCNTWTKKTKTNSFCDAYPINDHPPDAGVEQQTSKHSLISGQATKPLTSS